MTANEIQALAQDDIPAALDAVARAINDPATTLPELAGICLQGARLAAQLHDWKTCRQLASKGLGAALDANLGPEAVGALAACEGAAAVHQGDTVAGISLLMQALSLAEVAPEVASRKARILYNLATARCQQKNYTEAVMLFDQAADEFHRQGLESLSLSARLEVVWAITQGGDTPKAQKRLQQVKAALSDGSELTATWLLYAANLAAAEKRWFEAHDYAAQVAGAPGADPGTAAEALVILGQEALVNGQKRDAADMATAALELAMEGGGYSGLLNRIQELRIQAEGVQ